MKNIKFCDTISRWTIRENADCKIKKVRCEMNWNFNENSKYKLMLDKEKENKREEKDIW